MTTSDMVARIIWYPTMPSIHSILLRGVVASFLMIFSSRYRPLVLTAPKTPVVRRVIPITPGMKKSMYRMFRVTRFCCWTLMLVVELERCEAEELVLAKTIPFRDWEDW